MDDNYTPTENDKLRTMEKVARSLDDRGMHSEAYVVRQLQAENEAMQHDIEKYAAISAEQATENARLREALEPSGATKCAYIGEFKFSIDEYDPDEPEQYREREVIVPWTTIKEIMAAIREQALNQGDE